MYKIETEYHFITSNENTAPKYICSGLCKKAYWQDENKRASILEVLRCESCDGVLKQISKDDYRVLEYKITPQQKKSVTIEYLSQVKPEYEEYAKANWVNK